MRRMMCVGLGFAAVVLSGSVCVHADGRTVTPRIERVMLFKNGVGYFSSSAVLPDRETTVRFGQLPVASLGTFWVGYAKGVQVRGLYTSLEEVTRDVPPVNIVQFLSGNIGRKVTIWMNEKSVEGTLAGVTQPAVKNLPNPYFMDERAPARPQGYSYDGYVGRVVMVKTDRGTVSLNGSSITRADIEGSDVVSLVSSTVRRPSLRMELGREAGGKTVGISYLARGITWAPSYRIDLSDDARAQVSAGAVIVNEVADLDDVRLDLVSGFPNMKFADIVSPMAMSQSLVDYLNALGRGRSDRESGRGGRDYSMQQLALNEPVYAALGSEAPLPGYSSAAGGLVAEDLFLYPVDEFRLKCGETAWVPLFTAEVPYEYIYTWRIPDFLDSREAYRNDAGREQKEPEEEVWHSCRLTNTMKMPWTTAPAEFVIGGTFTGQDVCYYTAPGAKTTVRINRAMNILARQGEFEVERKRNAAVFFGSTYDLVTVKGELKLRSRLEKEAKIEVTKEMSGEVRETSPAAGDIATAKGIKRVNPSHTLTWVLAVKPGEEQTITYTYQVFVRD